MAKRAYAEYCQARGRGLVGPVGVGSRAELTVMTFNRRNEKLDVGEAEVQVSLINAALSMAMSTVSERQWQQSAASKRHTAERQPTSQPARVCPSIHPSKSVSESGQ